MICTFLTLEKAPTAFCFAMVPTFVRFPTMLHCSFVLFFFSSICAVARLVRTESVPCDINNPLRYTDLHISQTLPKTNKINKVSTKNKPWTQMSVEPVWHVRFLGAGYESLCISQGKSKQPEKLFSSADVCTDGFVFLRWIFYSKPFSQLTLSSGEKFVTGVPAVKQTCMFNKDLWKQTSGWHHH